MHSPDELAAAQRAFAQALTAFGAAPEASFWSAFAEPPAKAARRFAAYQRNATGNWRAALASTYPVVAAVLGASTFRTLADAYIEAYPSADGDLNAYGGSWPEFLQTHPVARELIHRQPYLPPLARLEWALLLTYQAPAGEDFDLRSLAEIPAAQHGDLRFCLWPGATLVSSDFPIVSIWQAHQLPADERDAALAALPGGAEHALTVRVAGLVSAIALTPGEGAFLLACRAQQTLTDAITAGMLAGAAAGSGAVADFAPAAALQRFVGTGTLTGFAFNLPGETP